MTGKIKFIFGIACCALFATALHAQQHQHRRWEDVERADAINIDSTTKDGYTLIFINQ